MMSPLDLVKSTLDTVKQVHDAKLQIELTQKIIELQQLVFDRDETIRKQRDEIREYKEKISNKEEITAFIATATRRDNAFWVSDVAYCIRCAEAGMKRSLTPGAYGNGRCPECKNKYGGVYPLDSPIL